MKVLHLTTVPMTLMFLKGQAAFMRARGVELSAISSPGPELDAFGAEEGVAVYAAEMPRRISPARDLAAVLRICRRVRALRPDVVHAHTPKGGLLGMIAAWLCRVPARVYTVHGMPFVTATGAKRRLLRTTERVSCALAHRVLCVSPSVRDLAVAEGVCPAEKAAVLGSGSANGADAEGKFNPTRYDRRAARAALDIPPDARVVGFVGRIVRDTGVVELAEAWRALRDEFPALWLLVVGPVEPQDPVPPAVLEALRTDRRVVMPGALWDTPPLFAAMDVAALPSYREGFGIVNIEAAAMGVPVVATRVAGCVDAVADGMTGTLVPPRDPAALAAAVRRYLADPDLRQRHGEEGRRRVLREFRPESIWEGLYREYCRLAGRPCGKLQPA